VSASLDSQLLLAHSLGVSKSRLATSEDKSLNNNQIKNFEILINLRAANQPLAYLIRQLEFANLEFFVDPRVLKPRAETEVIVEKLVKELAQNSRVLDLGTGSGNLAISLKYHRPDLRVTGSDYSPEALEVAKINQIRLIPDHKIDWLVSDIFDQLPPQKFDAIVANLPYLPDGIEVMPETSFEPAVALYGGKTGLELYQKMFDGITEYLNPGAKVWVESDRWQQPTLELLAQPSKLEVYYQDYFITGFRY